MSSVTLNYVREKHFAFFSGFFFLSLISLMSKVFFILPYFVVVDIDECGTNVHNCDGNAQCTNTPGTFTCACNSGYNGDGTSCSGNQAFRVRSYYFTFLGSFDGTYTK